MKAIFINTGIKLASLSLIILFLMSCNHDNNDTGYAYMPDMAYSYAFETYGSSPNFSDSITMLTPVEGTIPREMIPYQYEKTFEDQQRAGQELINPFETNKENLIRGKEQYTIYCSMCHGAEISFTEGWNDTKNHKILIKNFYVYGLSIIATPIMMRSCQMHQKN